MTDFNYTVKKGDNGLTKIFLREAKENGYTGDSSKINWKNVMSVFDQVQEEEKAQGEQLYSGGNDKTPAGWGKNYVIKIGQVIKLSAAQLDKIYTAMGFTKIEKKDAKPADDAKSSTPKAQAPADNASKPQAKVPTEKQAQVEADYASIEVTVDKKERMPVDRTNIDAIAKAQKEANKVVDDIIAKNDAFGRSKTAANLDNLKMALSGINKDNVAYVLQRIPDLIEVIEGVDLLGKGLDMDDVSKYVLKPLQEKALELKTESKFKDKVLENPDDYSIKDITVTAKKIAEQIRTVNKAEADKYNDTVRENNKIAAHNRDLVKIEKVFGDANRLLAEVANMTKFDYQIKTGHYTDNNKTWKKAILPDGRYIKADYNEKGEIVAIKISYDTNPDKSKDGTTFDGAEVAYFEDNAWYDTNKENEKYEGNITNGYDFDALKALVKKIFEN